MKKILLRNKHFLLPVLFLLTLALSVSASFTVAKYTKTVYVGTISIEIENKPPILYRGFATVAPETRDMNGVDRIVMGSFERYKNTLNLTDADWTNREEKYWVQQESDENPEGTNLRGGIRLFFRDEITSDGRSEKVAYVLAKRDYPVIFPIDSNSMFEDLHGLSSVDFVEIDTTLVTNMRRMFYGCRNLQTLDVSKFKTDKVTDMCAMFAYCTTIEALDLSNLDTTKVTDMESMFQTCVSLTYLNVSSFDTSCVKDMNHMFYECKSLSYLNVSNFNTGNVTDMNSMFAFCEHIWTLDVSNFDTANVTNLSHMFEQCHAVQTLNVSGINTAKVTDMNHMFYNCNSLPSLDVSRFDTSSVTDMNNMFAFCEQLITLDVSNFDTSKVTNMCRMFYGAWALTTIYVGPNWTTDSVMVDGGAEMFYDSWHLVGGLGTAYDGTVKDITYARIDGGPSDPGYFTISPDLATYYNGFVSEPLSTLPVGLDEEAGDYNCFY